MSLTDDAKNDLKSLNRLLHRKLTFIAKLNLSQNPAWWLPFAIVKPQENLRQAAERALKELVNDKKHFTFYGNAPVGYYKWRFPKPIQKSTSFDGLKVCSFDGLKMFVFKATTISRSMEIKTNQKVVDYEWTTHEDLRPRISSDLYGNIKITPADQTLIKKQTGFQQIIYKI
uniref:Uncharacterized protein n=1 Tax=Romanomermis culicivorax TaxID=13658 RepID=A0A915I897_ROMCU